MTNNLSNDREPASAGRLTARKRRKSGKPEILLRNVEISSFDATVRLHVVHHKGDEPHIGSQPWLELRGTATEPIRDVNVKISMFPKDKPETGTARPASVGAIIGARPELSVVLTWPQVDFDRVWALAVAGHLKYAHLYFTKPHYNSGLVVSASFSNELEE
jgi:hypothetical protein